MILLTIHYESTKHVQRAIQMSKDMGARVIQAKKGFSESDFIRFKREVF